MGTAGHACAVHHRAGTEKQVLQNTVHSDRTDAPAECPCAQLARLFLTAHPARRPVSAGEEAFPARHPQAGRSWDVPWRSVLPAQPREAGERRPLARALTWARGQSYVCPASCVLQPHLDLR